MDIRFVVDVPALLSEPRVKAAEVLAVSAQALRQKPFSYSDKWSTETPSPVALGTPSWSIPSRVKSASGASEFSEKPQAVWAPT